MTFLAYSAKDDLPVTGDQDELWLVFPRWTWLDEESTPCKLPLSTQVIPTLVLSTSYRENIHMDPILINGMGRAGSL